MSRGDLLEPCGTRPLTIPAMRAAVIALRAGVFDCSDAANTLLGDGLHAAGIRTANPWAVDLRMPWADVDGPVVVVLSGHAGAGASTIALAMGEALAEQAPVQLVEYARPAQSGLVAASTRELGSDDTCWRRGRRGRLDLFRLARCPADGETPPPPGDPSGRLLVVDVGWSLAAALLGSQVRCTSSERVVVVTRVTAPAVRQTEQVLAALGGDVAVAAVGPTRWPRVVAAGCGPRLGELRSRGRVVRVPIDRRLETAGLTGDPLPKPVVAAGRALADLIVPAPAPSGRRRTESPRVARAGADR